MRIRTLALCLAISTVTAFAQHDSAAWYHPLHTGNEWLFKKTESTHSFMQPTVTTETFFTRIVAGDTVINDKQYSIILEQDLLSLQKKSIFERYDSSNGTFYRLSSSTEEMLDSVFCQSPNMPFDGMKMKFIGAAADTFIGTPTHTRTTQLNVTGATIQWSFSYGIGITKETDWSQDSFFGTDITHALVHAKINGIEYGTEPLSVGNKLHRTPIEFALYQNYPNPFNPSTVISFTIPDFGARNVLILRIFDMLGRDIRTLVNEPLPPGRHTVRFDATGLATGLYFYHIQSGTFADTKKMMYIK